MAEDKNKVKFGLENVHYAVITETAGVTTYATPVKIPGAVELSLDPAGEQIKFAADNKIYFSSNSNDGYEGSLELALVPDQFKKDILGYETDTNGILFENATAIPKNFALLFEFSGDANATRHVMYKVSAARPSIGSKTTGEGIEVQTETLEIVATTPVDSPFPKAKTVKGDTGYDAWYDAVYKHVGV